SVASGDLDLDGKADLVTANVFFNTGSVLFGTATGFSPSVDFSTGTVPSGVVVADFNGDGKPDLAVANSGSNSVSVLLNATPLVDVPAALDAGIALGAIVPNPSHGAARIPFSLARAGHVRVGILDLQGRRVATLVDGDLPSGRHQAVWNGAGGRGRV